MEEFSPFNIAGQPALIRPLLDILAADPEVVVLQVTENGRADPERLLVSMTPTRAEALQTALGSRVLIEADQEVHPI